MNINDVAFMLWNCPEPPMMARLVNDGKETLEVEWDDGERYLKLEIDSEGKAKVFYSDENRCWKHPK